jgi:uncharacterized protein YpiB (UPF0302 family)
MNPGKKDVLFAAMVHAAMLASIHSQVEKLVKETKEIESFSTDTNRVMKEIEQFNLMNAINKALDERDEDAFMRLTGELMHA